jgi:hypothetical protein
MFTPRLRKVTKILTCLAVFLWVAAALGLHRPASISDRESSKSPRYAFATLLITENDDGFPDIKEPYLQAARLLTFQLLRNPRTRCRIDNVPFLILVTPDISQRHRDVLRREGATVIPLESIDSDWGSPESQRWNRLLAKLSLWKLEEYDKIVFLDVCSVIFRPIHDIFEDPATINRFAINPTAKMPKSYMIAAPDESWMKVETLIGQEPGQKSHLDNGFLVLRPSKRIHSYYTSLLHTIDKHDSGHAGQHLLEYAHRADGPMPWQILKSIWSLKNASQSDYEKGLKSISHKWWHHIDDKFVGDRIAMSMDEMTAYLNH